MHTSHDDQRVNSCQNCTSDKSGCIIQPNNSSRQIGSSISAQRSQNNQLQRSNYHQRQCRHQHITQAGRDHFIDEFFDRCCYCNRQDHRKNRARIIAAVHGQSEQRDWISRVDHRSKVRMNQTSTQCHSDEYIYVEFLRCGITDNDRQEIESNIAYHAENVIGRAIDRQNACVGQHLKQRFQHTTCDHDRNNRSNTASDRIHKCPDCKLLLWRIQIFIHRFLLLKSILLANRIISLVHILTNNDLKLVSCPLCSHSTRNFFDFVQLNSTLVLQIKTQPCDTMNNRTHIVLAADQLDNAVGKRIIIFCHVCFPPCSCKQFQWFYILSQTRPGRAPGRFCFNKKPQRTAKIRTRPQRGTQVHLSAVLWGKALQRRSAFIGHNPHEHTND